VGAEGAVGAAVSSGGTDEAVLQAALKKKITIAKTSGRDLLKRIWIIPLDWM
jgi:hypothetical protein